MGNVVRKIFRHSDLVANTPWRAPGGVRSVRVIGFRNRRPIDAGDHVLFSESSNIIAWGRNVNGQVGDDSSVTPYSSPVIVVGDVFNRSIVDVSASLDSDGANGTSMALTFGGQIYAWGLNDHGQLGLGDVTARSSATLISYDKKFIAVQSNQSSYAIDDKGDMYAWGLNTSGQLGVNDTTPRSTPTLVNGGIKWTQVSAVYGSSVHAIDEKGHLWGWGLNASGQLGDGTNTSRSVPKLIDGSKPYKQVISGAFHHMALDFSGNVYCWSDNTFGQMGDGTQVTKSVPTLVLGGHNFIQVASGQGCKVGMTTSGALYWWGRGTYAFGGITGTDYSSPVLVDSALSDFSFSTAMKLYAGTRTMFVVDNNWDVYSWGASAHGELGSGNAPVEFASSPVAVVGPQRSFNSFTLALRSTIIDVKGGYLYRPKDFFDMVGPCEYVALEYES